MLKLAGKVAVVTGGNSGIGLATAKLLAENGAQVVITGRNANALSAARTEIGRDATAIQGDVSDLDDLDRLFAEIKAKHGRIDILFANAGIAPVAPLPDVTPQFFDTLFGTNVRGVFFTVQKSLPLLADGASIILNASVVAARGMANFSVYSATKAAVRSFARSFANELKERNIRVNSVSPGPIATPIFTKLGLPAEAVPQTLDHIAQQVPMGRFGEPIEIAKAVLYLASDDSSYVTGFDLTVDGGYNQI